MGLVSDCSTVMVHTGKRFKALTDSGAALSLACTRVYNIIEDYYKTKILPAAVYLGQQMNHQCLHLERLPYTFACF